MRARTLTILALALAGALLAAPASADVYKCTINGEVRYQDGPCPGSEGQKPHLEIKEEAPPPATPSAAAPLPDTLPVAPEDKGTLADPNLGSAGGEATPAQLREAYEAKANAPRPAPAPAAAPAAPSPIEALNQRIVDAQSAQRELLRQQREAMAALAEKHAGREDSEAAIAERRAAEYDWRQRRLRAAEEERSLRSEIERLCPNGTYTTYGRVACR